MANCAGCKKPVDAGDVEQLCAVYTCRQNHTFYCCKVDCKRTFEKRCSKVMDFCEKIHHKLHSAGSAPALRRMPPNERDKFKQIQEAQSNDLMVCPEDVKAFEKSIPHCSSVIFCVGGTHQKAELNKKAANESAPPPPARHVPQKPDAAPSPDSLELVSDEMLQVLKRDDEDILEDIEQRTAPKPKKKTNKEKKRGTPLLIDWPISNSGNLVTEDNDDDVFLPSEVQRASSQEASTTPPSVASLRSPAEGAMAKKLNLDRAKKIDTLISTTQCTELRATQLLEANGWDLDKSADAFFRQGMPVRDYRSVAQAQGPQPIVSSAAATAAAAAASVENRETSKSAGSSGTSTQTGSPQTSTSSSSPHVECVPRVAAPKQPPPPWTPPDWRAVWSEDEGSYYFWHMPTNATQWENPTTQKPEVPVPTSGPDQVEKTDLIKKVSNIAGIEHEAAQTLLEEQNWNLEHSIRVHSLREEERKKAEAARKRAEIEAKKRQAEEERAAAAAAAAAAFAARAAEEQEQAKKRALEVERARAAQSIIPKDKKIYVAKRHWLPRAEVESCLRINHGQLVELSLADDVSSEWAYVKFLDDASQEGYVPKAILEAQRRPARPRRANERYRVEESFEEPQDVHGYLSVNQGDEIRLLHDVTGACVWAFAERWSSKHSAIGEQGWIPECVLADIQRQNGSLPFAPDPAG